MTRIRQVAFAALVLTIGGLSSSPARAQVPFPTQVTGRWVAQSPVMLSAFQFGPGLGVTPDGAVVGRFAHEEFSGVVLMSASQGQYVLRPVAPDLAVLTLLFDNGVVVTVADHPVNGMVMEVFHNGRPEIYLRQ